MELLDKILFLFQKTRSHFEIYVVLVGKMLPKDSFPSGLLCYLQFLPAYSCFFYIDHTQCRKMIYTSTFIQYRQFYKLDFSAHPFSILTGKNRGSPLKFLLENIKQSIGNYCFFLMCFICIEPYIYYGFSPYI